MRSTWGLEKAFVPIGINGMEPHCQCWESNDNPDCLKYQTYTRTISFNEEIFNLMIYHIGMVSLHKSRVDLYTNHTLMISQPIQVFRVQDGSLWPVEWLNNWTVQSHSKKKEPILFRSQCGISKYKYLPITMDFVGAPKLAIVQL